MIFKKKRLPIEIEELLDEYFPKGECKERGNALVLVAKVSLYIQQRDIQVRLDELDGVHIHSPTDAIPEARIMTNAGGRHESLKSRLRYLRALVF